MGAHFLCCLPIRLGAFILTLLMTLGYGATLAAMTFITIQGHVTELWNSWEKSAKIGYIVIFAISAIFFLVSLSGLIGVLGKKIGFLKTYVSFYTVLLVIQAVGSVGGIIMIWITSNQKFIDACHKVNDKLAEQNSASGSIQCDDVFGRSSWKIGITVNFLINLLVAFYHVLIVGQYTKKLEKKRRASHDFVRALHTDKNNAEMEALTHHKQDYPYSDASNSFGHNRTGSHV